MPTSGTGSGRRTLQVLQPSAVNKNLGRIIEVCGGGCILDVTKRELSLVGGMVLKMVSPCLEWQSGSKEKDVEC